MDFVIKTFGKILGSTYVWLIGFVFSFKDKNNTLSLLVFIRKPIEEISSWVSVNYFDESTISAGFDDLRWSYTASLHNDL